MNPGTCSGVTSNWPFGLFISVAIFAMSLFGPIPADDVSFPKNRAADHLRERPWCAGMRGYIQIRFVEREWFNQRGEPM
jgi:hypothetical protein